MFSNISLQQTPHFVGIRIIFTSIFGLPLLFLVASSTEAQRLLHGHDGMSPSPAQLWRNNPTNISSFTIDQEFTIRAILQTRMSVDYAFACGFYCKGACMNYMFGVYIIQTESDGSISSNTFPEVVWSANRNRPVQINSTLRLTSDGGLSLKDSDEAIVWSTNTSGKSVVGMNLTVEGNLVLFDKNNATIWQSFDYPTDTLVLGQRLRVGQKLTASVSPENWPQAQVPLPSFTVTRDALVGLMETDPPQIYYTMNFPTCNDDTCYVQYENGSLSLFSDSKFRERLISFPPARSAQFMRLDSIGHLKVFEFPVDPSESLIEVADILNIGVCDYPLICGPYGICTNGQCNCPTARRSPGNPYLQQNDERRPELGCSLVPPLSCEDSMDQSFFELKNITIFSYWHAVGSLGDLYSIDQESCKEACAKNCSCKVALVSTFSSSCYLPSQIFSFIDWEQNLFQKNFTAISTNFTAYIKVQNPSNKSEVIPSTHNPNMIKGKTNGHPILFISSIIGAFFSLTLLIRYLIRRRKYADGDDVEDDYFDRLPNMPSRFSYEDLYAATFSFSQKLGSGGFGSVFKGTMSDGTQVAVKKLEGFGHLQDSFLAEVKTIGSIHHIKLVRLVGFCAEKSHRLLVYEYMANGSLDQWIFHKKNDQILEWKQRKKIILDIANGIHYLHEGCRQKILHLDIKPQNILLDENFGAKVADFGLSKLIDRDQSQVITTMKGTPGYLAPEWLSSVISEKVDVYSFGVVILEVVCGRKVFDDSLVDEEKYLPGLLKRKAQEDKLLDMVDKYSEDMQLHGLEAVDMMKVAAWCLQGDFAKRPSMAMITKVLSEGFTDLRVDLDFNLSSPTWVKVTEGICQKGAKMGLSTILLLPSVLSGPR